MEDTPKIRFKGFTDAWEQWKVTNLLKNSSSAMKIGPFGSALKKEFFVQEGVKVYAQENAFTGDFSIGNYYITEEKYRELQSCELYPGDLVISMMGTIGACAIFPETAKKGIMNSHLLRLQFGDKVLPKYIMFLLRDSDLIRAQIDRLSVGSIMSGLSSSIVKKLVFPVPRIEEQKKIVNYLGSIDGLITLHQRKCDDTKELKKYMLQKIFPQNGKKIPEIRFAGFTGDWEQRKFSDFTWFSGKRNKEDLDLEPYAITNEHGFIPQNEAHDDFGYMKDTDRKAYNIVAPNSFAYNPARINVGSIGYYEGTENVIVSSLYEVFQTANDVNDKFLWHWFKSDEFSKWIERLQEGSVRLYFYYDKLCECQVPMPCVDEQKEIAVLLDNLDHLIILHQRKCNELKEVKRFMLQNMFPQKG